MRRKPSVGRREFVRRFMHSAGLSYAQACSAYACMISVIEDAVVNGEKVGFGRVGSLCPTRKPPRDVTMGFERKPGGVVERTRRVFHLPERVAFLFRPYKSFTRSHQFYGS